MEQPVTKQETEQNASMETVPLKKQHKHPKLMAQAATIKSKIMPVPSQEAVPIKEESTHTHSKMPVPSEPLAQPAFEDPVQVKQLKQVKTPTRAVVTPPLPEIKVTSTLTPNNEAKKQAVQAASSRYAHYTSTDGLYFNYIIPSLPMYLINPEVQKETSHSVE